MAQRQRAGTPSAALTTESVERVLRDAGIVTARGRAGMYVPPSFVQRLVEHNDRRKVHLVRDVIRAVKRPEVLELLGNGDIAAAFIRDPKISPSSSIRWHKPPQAGAGARWWRSRGQVTNTLLDILLSRRGSAEFRKILQDSSRRIAAAGGDVALIKAISPGEALLHYVNGMVAAHGTLAARS